MQPCTFPALWNIIASYIKYETDRSLKSSIVRYSQCSCCLYVSISKKKCRVTDSQQHQNFKKIWLPMLYPKLFCLFCTTDRTSKALLRWIKNRYRTAFVKKKITLIVSKYALICIFATHSFLFCRRYTPTATCNRARVFTHPRSVYFIFSVSYISLTMCLCVHPTTWVISFLLFHSILRSWYKRFLHSNHHPLRIAVVEPYVAWKLLFSFYM